MVAWKPPLKAYLPPPKSPGNSGAGISTGRLAISPATSGTPANPPGTSAVGGSPATSGTPAFPAQSPPPWAGAHHQQRQGLLLSPGSPVRRASRSLTVGHLLLCVCVILVELAAVLFLYNIGKLPWHRPRAPPAPVVDKSLTCEGCCELGRSWQLGKCNPVDKRCALADTACFTDVATCTQWHKQVEATPVCKKQTSCGTCIDSNELCIWKKDAKMGDHCLMGAKYWGPMDKVVRTKEKCG